LADNRHYAFWHTLEIHADAAMKEKLTGQQRYRIMELWA